MTRTTGDQRTVDDQRTTDDRNKQWLEDKSKRMEDILKTFENIADCREFLNIKLLVSGNDT